MLTFRYTNFTSLSLNSIRIAPIEGAERFGSFIYSSTLTLQRNVGSGLQLVGVGQQVSFGFGIP